MARPKPKFYTVWHGRSTGVFATWQECEAQVKGFAGAKYKAFDTYAQARAAFADSPDAHIAACPGTQTIDAAQTHPTRRPRTDANGMPILPPEVPPNALAVDAACAGNPGPMEYRGVYLATGAEVFRYGPVYGTNNIGEFLAIVHAFALMHRKGINLPVYSDSRIAQGWVRKQHCATKLPHNERTAPLHRLIARAEQWLRTHDTTPYPLLKWNTGEWGEVPADFGRK